MNGDQPIRDALVYNGPDATLGGESSIPVAPMPASQPLDQTVSSPPPFVSSPEEQSFQPQVHESLDKLRLFRFNKSAMLATIVALILISAVGVGGVLFATSNRAKTNSLAGNSNIEQNYKPQSLGVSNVSGYNKLLTGQAQNLTVNGQLSVSNSLVLSPSTAPSNPKLGQLYYNGGNDTPYFYNGKNFVSLLPISGGTIAGGSPNLGLGTGLSLQGSNLVNTGVTSVSGTPDQILISSNRGSVQISLPSSISANSITSGVLNSLSHYEINGVPLNSSNLSDGGNLAKLTGSGPQAFTGNNEFTGKVIDQNAVNSTSAFSVQNAAGANIFTADTTNSAISIGQGNSLLSTTSTNPDSPYYLAVAGNYSYVLSISSNTLQVFNISNPASPSLVNTISTGNCPANIAASGSYIYVVNSCDNTLQVFNISNPASPGLVSTTATAAGADWITVSGNYAYVVNGSASNMQVFNVSNPSSPVLISTTVTGNDPVSVAVSGNYAYVVSDTYSTLQVFNVSNPSSPVPDSTTITGNTPVSVAVSGNIVYVLNSGNNTLQIFDVTNASKPVLDSTTITGNTPSSLSLSGHYVYITNGGDNTLQMFDVTHPASPITAGAITTGSCPDGVSNANGYAFVINGCDNTLQVFNVLASVNVNVTGNLSVSQIISGSTLSLQGTNSNTSSTESANLITNSDFTSSAWSAINNSNPVDVAYSNNYAYVINNKDTTLQIFNVTNPNSPVSVSTTVLGGSPYSVAISGNYAFVVNIEPYGTPSELQVFDISNPASPVSVNTTTLNGSPESIAISGNYAYIPGAGSGESYFDVYDITTPSAPVLAGSVNIGRSYDTYVTVSGNYAYVADADNSELKIINISNPAAPSLISTTATGSWPNEVAVSGNYAYVINDNDGTFQIFDISNPASPVSVSTTAPNEFPYAMAVSGNYAYVLEDGYGQNSIMQVFDISNPASPMPVASPTTSATPIYITLSGNYAYLVTNSSTFQVFDISSPLSPILDSTTDTGSAAWSLSSGTATCISNDCNSLSTNQFNAVPGASYEVEFTTSGASGNSCFVSVGDSSTQASSCNIAGQQDVVVQATDTNGLSIYLNDYNQGISISNVQVYQINPAASSLKILDYQGNTALAVSTPGSYSEYIGVSSGTNSNKNSYNNTAMGDFALQNNTSGWNNTAIGKNALQNNSSGWGNTAIGENALTSNTVGTNNTAIGSNANVYDGLTNATVIGANTTAAESNALILGSNESVGINTSSPVSALDVQDPGGSLSPINASGGTPYNNRITQNISGSITPGLSATWYNSVSTNNAYQTVGNGTLAYSGTDGPIDWPNLSTSRPSGVNSTYINAQWTGYLLAPVTGQYSICTTSDDGSRVFLGSSEILNDWSSHAANFMCSTLNLMASVWYPITLQYFQGGGPASVNLTWNESDITNYAFQDIPLADLSSTEPTGNIYNGGFSIAPTVNIQGDMYSFNGTSGIQPDSLGVNNSNGDIVVGLTSYGALQGSNGNGDNIAGGNIIVAGGQGTGSGNGGSIDLQIAPAGLSGLASNNLLTVASISGVNGSALFENSTNSTTGFLVQNSTGTNIFAVDTSDGRVGIGTGTNTPGNLLSIGALTTAAGTYQIAVSTNGTTNSGIVVQDVASQSSGYAFMLQDSTGSTLAYVDYQGNLSVKSIAASGNLTLNGHVITGNTSGSTTSAAQASGLGSTGTCSLSPANFAPANDVSGTIVLTPNGTGIAAGAQCIVTFSSTYGSYPHVVISPADAASEALGAYASAASASTFSIGFSVAGSAGTSYTFNYFIAQ